MIHVANKLCRPLVQMREDFKGHQLFGRTEPNGIYVVYSYGEHWPLFAYKDGTWYENSEKYSGTTSKQRGQTHPFGITVLMSCEELKRLIRS